MAREAAPRTGRFDPKSQHSSIARDQPRHRSIGVSLYLSHPTETQKRDTAAALDLLLSELGFEAPRLPNG